MRIGQLAEASGLSAHTIRYYERIGLLPVAARNTSGQRHYDATTLEWIAFLGRLKATGMPIREMQRYAALRAEGPRTSAERREILEAHRQGVRKKITDLESCLMVLDRKIHSYIMTEEGCTADDAV